MTNKTKKSTRKKTKTASQQPPSDDVVFNLPKKPGSECLGEAYVFFEYGVESANHLWTVYKNLTKGRGRGAPSHADQDVLRAMFIMSAATLDATLKKMIKDSLPTLISKSPECFQEVSKIIQRQLLEQLDKRGEVIAKAFLSNDAKQTLIDEVIEYKTGDSLQSSQQVQQICKFFGISQPSKEKMSDLDKAFKARNQIIHRLDEDPAHPKRKRKQRKMDELKKFTETTFFIVSHIIQKVDTNLSSSQIESKIESQALEKLSEKGD